jgi:hypothetical protein
MTASAPVPATLPGDPTQIAALAQNLNAMHQAAGDASTSVNHHIGRLDSYWQSHSADQAKFAMGVTARRLDTATGQLAHAAGVLNTYSADLAAAQSQHQVALAALTTAQTAPVADPAAVAQHTRSVHTIASNTQALARAAAHKLLALAAPPAPVVPKGRLDALSATLLNAAVDVHQLSRGRALKAARRISTLSKANAAVLAKATNKANAGTRTKIYNLLGSGVGVKAAIAQASQPDWAKLHGPSLAAAAAAQAGFRGHALVMAIAISGAESGYQMNQVSPNPGSIDQGLWQINNVAWPQYSHQKLLNDPAYNAKAAFAISNGGSNWGPWTTYQTGAYQSYMSGAERAAKTYA